MTRNTAGHHYIWPLFGLLDVSGFSWKQEQTVTLDKKTSRSPYIVQAYQRQVIQDERSLQYFALETAALTSMHKMWTAGRPSMSDFLDNSECLETLITHGARLDLLGTSGKSFYHHAYIQNESAGLKRLLRLSPESHLVTVKDHGGNTALIESLRHRSVESAMVLLKLDDVGDVVGQGGWSTIHYAARLGNVDVLEAVLQHPNFVKDMRTIDGETAQTVAMEAGNWCGKVKDLLRSYNSMG